MELAIILVPIFVFVLFRSAMESRQKDRAEKLRVLEEAIKTPGIDRATINSLAHQLTGKKPPRTPGESGRRAMAWVLALGWLTLFAGLGVVVLGEMISCSEASAAGLLTALVGFGIVTYPFALRELESRRNAA